MKFSDNVFFIKDLGLPRQSNGASRIQSPDFLQINSTVRDYVAPIPLLGQSRKKIASAVCGIIKVGNEWEMCFTVG